jgi:hypothetical protein
MADQRNGWVLDQDRLVLDLYHNGRHQYEVDLETCDDASALLDWICQVAGKSDDFISDAELGQLVRRLNLLLWPQETMVRAAKPVDVAALVARNTR